VENSARQTQIAQPTRIVRRVQAAIVSEMEHVDHTVTQLQTLKCTVTTQATVKDVTMPPIHAAPTLAKTTVQDPQIVQVTVQYASEILASKKDVYSLVTIILTAREIPKTDAQNVGEIHVYMEGVVLCVMTMLIVMVKVTVILVLEDSQDLHILDFVWQDVVDHVNLIMNVMEPLLIVDCVKMDIVLLLMFAELHA